MSAPFDSHSYPATIVRHVDADTTWAHVRLPFDVSINLTFRWAGIDSPERNTVEGKAALAEVSRLLPLGSTCTVTTVKDRREKFGRYLATFWTADGTNVNAWLVEAGFAVPYAGGSR